MCKGTTQRTTIPSSTPISADDLVHRNFSADRPDKLWLSDFTYIRTWEGWSYLAVVLDVHTRRIVGWQLANHMRQSLVSDAFEMALASRQEYKEGTMIAHSDNVLTTKSSHPWKQRELCRLLLCNETHPFT